MEKNQYDVIDCLRVVACIYIFMMYMFSCNNDYMLTGFGAEKMIPFLYFVHVHLCILFVGRLIRESAAFCGRNVWI